MKIDVRQEWLNYYTSLGFKIIPSAPLVHPSFPMSFNMSAGLVQLDPLVRSQKKASVKKECLVQKCFRHFDVEKIGDDTHLSFFEMPGAFEVVDFDEAKTVELLWDFFVKRLQIEPNKIWITTFNKECIYSTDIYQNEEVINKLEDLANYRVIKGDKSTNFWMQGGGIHFTDNMRLCGPQVEFFYQIKEKTGNPLSNPEDFIEIGNTIAIKYFLDYRDMKIKHLVNPSTESVIGLERVVSVVETEPVNLYKSSLFDSALNLLDKSSITPDKKIICDHLKALLFLYAEAEIEPGKNGRNRIIRNLVRQILASCYFLGLQPSQILPQLTDALVNIYVDVYLEIIKSKQSVLNVILSHEIKYKRTLLNGKHKIDIYLQKKKLSEVTETDMEYFKEQLGITPKLFQFLQNTNEGF